MTFDEYIQNPMGKKNAVFSQRELYRNLYKEKLDNLLVRENGKIDYKLYYGKDEYFVHLKIPSEIVPNFYYDTVIRLSMPKNTVESSLKKYDVSFYSNDPSFVFTFAHAFINNDMFISDLAPKLGKEAKKNLAVEKNPTDQVGYVKSIYFAYLLMIKHNLFKKEFFKLYGTKYNKKALLSNIVHSDTLIDLRQEKEEEIRRKKKEAKQQAVVNKRKEVLTRDAEKRNTDGGKPMFAKRTASAKIAKRTKKIKRK